MILPNVNFGSMKSGNEGNDTKTKEMILTSKHLSSKTQH